MAVPKSPPFPSSVELGFFFNKVPIPAEKPQSSCEWILNEHIRWKISISSQFLEEKKTKPNQQNQQYSAYFTAEKFTEDTGNGEKCFLPSSVQELHRVFQLRAHANNVHCSDKVSKADVPSSFPLVQCENNPQIMGRPYGENHGVSWPDMIPWVPFPHCSMLLGLLELQWLDKKKILWVKYLKAAGGGEKDTSRIQGFPWRSFWRMPCSPWSSCIKRGVRLS